MKIGFVGTGMMGQPMAKNLTRAGHDVLVYDARPDALKPCIEVGAKAVGNVAAMRDCTIIFIIVSTASQVEDVLYGSEGYFAGKRDGMNATIVVMSTISPIAFRKIAEKAKGRGTTIVDAPVSGGPILAELAALSFMVGGTEDTVEKLRPYLSAMGNKIFHIGPSGTGCAMKLVNNIVALTNAYVFTETIRIADATGLDIRKAVDVINASSGKNWCSENWEMYVRFVGMVLNDEGFQRTAVKDLETALEWTKETAGGSAIVEYALSIIKSGVDLPQGLFESLT
jgi:3-hydroxyisobutyrate dehydrogenase-like beta-hydroxyacid dehydrogenase